MAMTKERFRELMKPITDGLFGEQKPYHLQELPHYKVRPLHILVEDLCAIPDEDWYAYAFSRENLNGKLNDEQRLSLMKQAMACGREYARRLMDEYGTDNPLTLAQRFGAKVDFPEMPQSKSRVLFAEYREPDKIHIFMDAVKKGNLMLSEPGVKDVFTERPDIKKLLIGHELFHMVEEKYKKTIWTKTYRILLWRIGPLKNTSTLHVLGEIAAMSFTQELNRLKFSPYVMDAFLVYGYDPETACGLYEEMMEKVGKKPRE